MDRHSCYFNASLTTCLAKTDIFNGPKKKAYFVLFTLISDIVLGSAENLTSAFGPTLHVPGSLMRLHSPYSTISLITSIPSAPLLATGTRPIDNSTKTEIGKLKSKENSLSMAYSISSR